MFNLNYFNTSTKLRPIQYKSAQKMNPMGFTSRSACGTLAKVKVPGSAINCADVTDVYRQGKYQEHSLKRLCVMSNVKVFRHAKRTDGQCPDGQTRLIS